MQSFASVVEIVQELTRRFVAAPDGVTQECVSNRRNVNANKNKQLAINEKHFHA